MFGTNCKWCFVILKLLNKFFHNQFLIFLCTGGIAAFVNFASRIFLNSWMSFGLAVIVSYVLGMVVAFILFKLVVFKQDGDIIKSLIKFILVNIIGIIITYYISIYVYSYLKNYDILFVKEISHFLGLSITAITSFVGHKYFSFKK